MTLPGTLSSTIGLLLCTGMLCRLAVLSTEVEVVVALVSSSYVHGLLDELYGVPTPSVTVCSSRERPFYTVTNVPKASTWKVLAF